MDEIKKGYTKSRVVEIIRAKHLIVFDIKTRKADLINMLKDVPDEATVDEVLEDNEGFYSIEFHEEVVN